MSHSQMIFLIGVMQTLYWRIIGVSILFTRAERSAGRVEQEVFFSLVSRPSEVEAFRLRGSQRRSARRGLGKDFHAHSQAETASVQWNDVLPEDRSQGMLAIFAKRLERFPASFERDLVNGRDLATRARFDDP